MGAELRPCPLAGWLQASHYTCLSLSFLLCRWDNRPYLPGHICSTEACVEPSLHTVPLSPTSLVAKKMGFKPVQESWGAGPSALAGAPHIQAQSHSRATDGGAGASDPPAGADRGPSRSVTGPRAARRAGRGLQPASWLRLASERAMAGHEGRAIWGARQEGHWCGARGPALGWKRRLRAWGAPVGMKPSSRGKGSSREGPWTAMALWGLLGAVASPMLGPSE